MLVVSPSITASQLQLQSLLGQPLQAFNEGKHKRMKRVSFGSDKTLAYIETVFELTETDKNNRWYQSEDIRSFKKSAKSLCQAIIVSSNSKNDEDKNNQNPDPSRKYRKRFIYHVLEAYHLTCDENREEYVAFLSEGWSATNRQRAIQTGEKDFHIAYNNFHRP
ncbi:MAG: hypothetical protein ACI8RD_011601 [Bacillariaceae sp.]|jgi:hypothetical protein